MFIKIKKIKVTQIYKISKNQLHNAANSCQIFNLCCEHLNLKPKTVFQSDSMKQNGWGLTFNYKKIPTRLIRDNKSAIRTKKIIEMYIYYIERLFT